MKKILVAYATMTGSTVEVAQVVSAEIAKSGAQVDVLPLSEIKDIETYDGVVVGGPMIMGWHRAALGFLKKHRKAFQRIPLAVFVTAMSLTQTDETSVAGVPVYVDAKLPKAPLNADKLTFRERYARLANYLTPILRAVRPAKPASLGIFGGRLEYGRLPWWGVMFVMLIIQTPARDLRNWDAVREWASGLAEALKGR